VTLHLVLGLAIVALAVLTSMWLPASVGISMALLGDALASRSSPEGLETS